jgi:hypothetical protein
MASSIFFDVSLPNSPTWFYLSFGFVVALFFQFNRFFGLRNWDMLALFLFVPGFLLIQEGNQRPGSMGGRDDNPQLLVGYIWLMVASSYWFARSLYDLAAIRRPLIAPNITLPGLIIIGSVLLLCLSYLGFTSTDDPWIPVGKRPAALTGAQDRATQVVNAQTNPESHGTTRFYVECSFALGCHLAVVTGLILIGALQFGDVRTGFAAGTLYLMMPYTAFHFSQAHHVWPAALILWSIYCFRRPTLSGALLGLAIGTTFFPMLVLPAWMQFYRGRGVGRFILGLSLTGIVGLGLTLLMLNTTGEFPRGVWRILHQSDWQPWRIPTSPSIWQGIHWAYRLPIFILYAGMVLTSWLWPPVRNLGQLIAFSAAVMIGIQFWYADRGGLYVLWFAPLMILLIVRPNLSESQPVDPGPLPAFFTWIGRRFWNILTLSRFRRQATTGS